MSEGTRSSEGSIGESARWIALGTAWKPGWGGEGQIGVGWGGGVKRNREDSQPAAILHVQVYTMCLYAMYMHHSPVWAGRGNG